jgi:8-oxo-dGTP diphosphatase
VRFRLSAGAIVVNQGKILLVKHGGPLHGSEFLIAPGGGIEGEESFIDAAIRETREETGLDVVPKKLLVVEDMVSSQKRVIKCWFLCDFVGGQLRAEGQTEEGVVEAGWFSKVELQNLVVYPTLLKTTDWSDFLRTDWQAQSLQNRDPEAEF